MKKVMAFCLIILMFSCKKNESIPLADELEIGYWYYIPSILINSTKMTLLNSTEIVLQFIVYAKINFVAISFLVA